MAKMDSTLSVSKGCFVFKKKTSKKKSSKRDVDMYCDDIWYTSYKELWNSLENKLEDLHQEIFSKVLQDLVCYIQISHQTPETQFQNTVVPTATLLTGINMPDHGALFSSLVNQLHEEVTPHVAMLDARKCRTVRATVEQMASQFMNTNLNQSCDSDSDDDLKEEPQERLKKSNCNFPILCAWYNSLYKLEKKSPKKSSQKSPSKKRKESTNEDEKENKKSLIIIIPDFEKFSSQVLQDFILILSGYRRSLPLVLVLSVATSVSALLRCLPFHVSSCICVRVFQALPSSYLLNQALDQVILNSNCPFHLGSKTFRFLMDVFLFFDFSVKGFIQGFKFCMMQHFCGQDWKSLCCSQNNRRSALSALSSEDLEQLRALPSFRRYVEKQPSKEQAPLLLDDEYCKTAVISLLKDLHCHLKTFHIMLRCLLVLTADLPKAPLGSQLRELYGSAVSSPIASSPEFKECFHLLGYQSRTELLERLSGMLVLLEGSKRNSPLRAASVKLLEFRSQLQDIGMETTAGDVMASPSKVRFSGSINRSQLKQQLLELSKQPKPVSAFEAARSELLNYLSSEMFPELLGPLAVLPLAEIMLFDDATAVRAHLVGTPRAAIHTALNDPQCYLECECCIQQEEGSLIATMPDLGIAYKLYLECGRYINLYDWMQAFVSVVSSMDKEQMESEKKRSIDPQLQARFTQAVAELEFMGFIKVSNRKVDHVTKLTWGTG